MNDEYDYNRGHYRDLEPESYYMKKGKFVRAVYNSDYEDIFELLKCDECIDVKDLYEGLYLAIQMDSSKIVSEIIASKRINFKQLNRSGIFPDGGILSHALMSSLTIFRMLIATGEAEPGFHNVKDSDAYTPLMVAAENCNVKAVNLLLLTGESNPRFTNKKGKNALNLAKRECKDDIYSKIRQELDKY